MRPALFVPEMKFGSELLKEMQHKNQQMAMVIDEYGSMAGVVTVEDLVEEIIGEIGEEDRRPAPDVIREAGGAMVLRGSVPVDKIAELFGVRLEEAARALECDDDRGTAQRRRRARAADGGGRGIRWLAFRGARGEPAQGAARSCTETGDRRGLFRASVKISNAVVSRV